ncbi:MAG: phosphatidylserine decarboxylase [Myxococcota bacterium]|nr:phosphatidylserine decarboxylase [Myxococcota bacterium]
METPQALRGPIAAPGYLFSGVLAVVAAGFVGLGLSAIGALALLLAGLNLAFFRNPERVAPDGDHRLVSPADGRVVEVTRIGSGEQAADEVVGSGYRIAIFLSVLDVHVNWIPISGKVRALRRGGSKFLAAFRSEASIRNVQSRLDLESASGLRIAVVQIAGLIARRIVCYVSEGDTLERGTRYGLICYGSRVELLLPRGCQPSVSVGDRVRGGETVVAEVIS